MKRQVRICIAIALFLSARAAAAAAQAPDFAALDAVVQEELKQAGVPGATVAIVSGGRVIYSKGYGTANAETGAVMTPDLLFRLGSTTKMFTAAALASLADRGAVDLRKPIGGYIKGLHSSLANLTGHQLLSHTSGILDEAPMFGSHDESALMKNVLSWKDDRFFTEPGKVYSYSNPGYWLAGALIEAVSGRLYADELQESLFAPLGMSRTTLRPTVAMTYPLAQGHDVADGKPVVVRPFANNAASWPAGSIFSSVNDLSRFVMAFVGGGAVGGKQVMSPAVIAMLSTPAAKIPGSDNEYRVRRQHQRAAGSNGSFSTGDRAADTVRASRWCRRNSSASFTWPTGPAPACRGSRRKRWISCWRSRQRRAPPRTFRPRSPTRRWTHTSGCTRRAHDGWRS